MKLKAIANFLETQGIGTPGENIFVNEMPVECQLGVLLLDRYSGTPINYYLPGYRSTGFRVATRGVDYEQAEALAQRVNAALTVMSETELPEMQVKSMLPMNDPRPYRRSAGALHEFEVDVEICYVIAE